MRISSDLETYLHLAHEETDAAQRQGILEEIERELDTADAYVAELETKTLLSGENDEEVQRSKRQDGYKRTRTNKTLLVYSTKTEWEATTIMSAGNANLSNAAVRSREL